MLLDENQLKEMDIPRGPRLKILNRIKNGLSTPILSVNSGSSSLASSSSHGSTTSEIETLQKQIADRKKRLSWSLTEADSIIHPPLLSNLPRLTSSDDNTTELHKIKRNSAEVRKKRASGDSLSARSPRRQIYGTLTKKSVPSYEEMSATSEGYKLMLCNHVSKIG